jgi:hypothetical protein
VEQDFNDITALQCWRNVLMDIFTGFSSASGKVG